MKGIICECMQVRARGYFGSLWLQYMIDILHGSDPQEGFRGTGKDEHSSVDAEVVRSVGGLLAVMRQRDKPCPAGRVSAAHTQHCGTRGACMVKDQSMLHQLPLTQSPFHPATRAGATQPPAISPRHTRSPN
jgi:hypothetical protein